MSSGETTISRSRIEDREQRIRLLYELSDAWNADRLNEVIAPDVSFRFANAEPGVGLEAYQGLTRMTHTIIESVRHTILRVIQDADSGYAVVELDMHYVHKNQSTLEIPCSVVFHFNDADLIDEYRIYLDGGNFFSA